MADYSAQMSWGDWLTKTQQAAQELLALSETSKDFYDKWAAFSYGKTNAQIATALGVAEANISDLAYCVGVLSDLSNFINNGAVSTFNRKGYLIPFV